MRRHRKRGSALLYLLAVLPMIALIGTMALQLTGELLRVQRTAMQTTVDLDSARRLVAQLRTDVAAAVGVEVLSNGLVLIVHEPDEQTLLSYRLSDTAVSRVESHGEEQADKTRWPLAACDLKFALETLESGGEVVWLQFEHHRRLSRHSIRSQRIGAAIAVGSKG